MNDYLKFVNNPCFSKRTDEEIILESRYKFNLPTEVLIDNSRNTRLARRNRRRGTNEIPRPQNAWIIYLRDKNASPELKGFQPKLISEMWKNESKEVIEVFEALARLSVKRHIEIYGPDYKYKPKPPKKSNVSKKCEEQDISDLDFHPPAIPAASESHFQDNTYTIINGFLIRTSDVLEHLQQCAECGAYLEPAETETFDEQQNFEQQDEPSL